MFVRQGKAMNQKVLDPTVSVIIPLYNVENYVRSCLDSIAVQTLQQIEVICVDDGSTDHSADIALEYVQKYPNFTLIQKENGGLSSARNAGMDAAHGRYLYFLDGDDSIINNALQEICAKADQEDLDIVYFDAFTLYENDTVKQANAEYIDHYRRKYDYSGITSGQLMFQQMQENHDFFSSVCMQLFRKSFLDENGIRFYDGILHEDNLFSLQCAILAARVNHINIPYFCRRMRSGSIMTAPKSMKNVEGYLIVYAQMLYFVHDHPVDEAIFPQLSAFLYSSIWESADRIVGSLKISEAEPVPSKEDFGVYHFLDAIKRDCSKEEQNKALNSSLRDRLQLAWDQNAQLKNRLELAWNQNTQRKERLELAWNQNAQLKGRLESAWEQNKQLQARLELAWNQNAQLKERLESAWEQNKQLKERLQLSWGRNAELQKQANEEKQATRIQAFEKELHSLKTRLMRHPRLYTLLKSFYHKLCRLWGKLLK